MNESELETAHAHSTLHKPEILWSQICGCFYCGSTFEPVDILEWIDDDQTALCPRCHIDAVIGDRSGIEITKDFLTEMHNYWFTETKDI